MFRIKFIDTTEYEYDDGGLYGKPDDDYDDMTVDDLKLIVEVYEKEFASGKRIEQNVPDYVWMRGIRIDLNKKSCIQKIKDIIKKEEQT